MPRSARRREQLALAAELRGRGITHSAIAFALRDRYGLNARIAARLARGWSQADTAAAWCARWPDDPKTFKNISYWENWPSPTGHAPSLAVLDRLTQLYECNVADLLAGWGEHGQASPAHAIEAETLAWQVEHLDLPELTRATADWARRLPDAQRRTLLLKLSTAASVAAGQSGRTGAAPLGRGPSPHELSGWWTSRYSYHSTGRGRLLDHEHRIELRASAGRLIGTSEATPSGSLDLDLRPDGLLVTGTWTERTSSDGYYSGAVYHGILQLVLDPTGRFMNGKWLGPDRSFTIDSGPWALRRVPSDAVPAPASDRVDRQPR